MADQFKFHVFPEDLSSDYYSHYMSIMAYIEGNPVYAAGLFIPGGGGGGPGLVYYDAHKYTEIKLAGMASGVLGAVGSAASGLNVTGGSIKAIASAVGHPITPQVEVLYTSTDTRSFDFSFLLAPSSEKEADSMKEIIKNLRRYAAPKKPEGSIVNSIVGNVFYEYPAEFLIKFYHGGKENTNVPKIRKCALTDVQVVYTPSGEWSTFLDGTPVACMMQLHFQELEIINRNLIEEGF